jgi:hypothetical protein
MSLRSCYDYLPLIVSRKRNTPASFVWVHCPDFHLKPSRSVRSIPVTTMKRKSTAATSKPKKARVEVPDYHLTPQRQDNQGSTTWPAPFTEIRAAKEFILDW